MCATCGCSGEPGYLGGSVAEHGDHSRAHEDGAGHSHEHRHDDDGEHDHPHDHVHPHPHEHAHEHRGAIHSRAAGAPLAQSRGGARMLRFEQEVLAKNDALAAENRAWLAAREVVAVNLMSSPGAGKTTLLERTIADLRGEIPVSVIEGDQETALDAERIRATGCAAIQINTGRGCHLDAVSVGDALRSLDPTRGGVVLIENVGNLVCPAMFDLGERAKVVIVSVTEGEDKPLKYPHMFRASQLMVLNKVDLLPHVRFDVARCVAAARSINPRLEVVEASATHGDGLRDWYGWLRARFADRA